MHNTRIREAYDAVTLSPESAARIWARLESELPPGEEKRSMKKLKNPVRIFIVAALIAVLMVGSAYAISGMAAYTGTHRMQNTGEFTSLSALPKVEKTAGYPITAVPAFSNGYTFQSMYLGGEAVFDETNNPIREYYSVKFTYTKPGARDLTVSVSPLLDTEGSHEPPAPTGTRVIGGVTVSFSRDTYKLVPEDYEKTEADKAAEAAGHFYISFGSDAVEEHTFAFVGFPLDGAEYVLMDMAADADSEETLYAMAAELIAARN